MGLSDALGKEKYAHGTNPGRARGDIIKGPMVNSLPGRYGRLSEIMKGGGRGRFMEGRKRPASMTTAPYGVPSTIAAGEDENMKRAKEKAQHDVALARAGAAQGKHAGGL